MKVLLLISDLYKKKTGGGEHVYKKIIQSCPNVNFFYFLDEETNEEHRPVNCTGIKLLKANLTFDSYFFFNITMSHHKTFAHTIAKTLKNKDFDIIELPDWNGYGRYLKDAFLKYNVSYKKFILSMHGNISDTLKFQDKRITESTSFKTLKYLEREQFKSADECYSISPGYIKLWKKEYERDIYFHDPLQFLYEDFEKVKGNLKKEIKKSLPNIYCIGRMERRKGHENFIDMLNFINKDFYNESFIIGNTSTIEDEKYINYLKDLANRRSLNVNFNDKLKTNDLAKLYFQNSLVVLPVGFDSFNLVALDALFSGCPVVISNKALICEYLDKHHSDLPYIKIDMDNYHNEIYKINDALKNFFEIKNQLFECLKEKNVTRSNFSKYYSDVIKNNKKKNQNIIFSKKSYTEKVLYFFSIFYIKSLSRFRRFIIHKLLQVFNILNLKKYKKNQLANISYYLFTRLKNLFIFNGINSKLQNNYTSIDRGHIWYDLFKVNLILNNNYKVITYGLRVLRELKYDENKKIFSEIYNILREKLIIEKFNKELETLDILKSKNNNKITNYIKKNALKLKSIEYEDDLVIKKDFRKKELPKVSIIVSLYKAEKKLEKFLNLLNLQSIDLTKNIVEVILIDSNSPEKEFQIFEKFLNDKKINAVYFKSNITETIQKTWNRGILKSRGKYLVFLGVDETLTSNSLKVLSEYLDKNKDIDWVCGNTLVTSLDKNSYFDHDVMSHIRNGAEKELTYLETCYTYWVGGMYRKEIHNKFGYYDDAFKVAGDTEFKSRILKFMNVGYIDQNLGIFLNYPDERKSESPLAEIEDLRAWYLYRSQGGLDYIFENYETNQLKKFLVDNFIYRKSYSTALSFDFEFFYELSKKINEKSQDQLFIWVEKKLKRILDILQKISFLPEVYFFKPFLIFIYFNQIKIILKKLILKLKNKKNLNNFLHDNSFEQHTRYW